MQKLALHRARTLETSWGPLHYLLHEPPGFAVEKRPLLLFLHGAGERGTDLSLVCKHGIPAAIERGKNVPFIAVSPQCPPDTYWSALTPALQELLDRVVGETNADERRIYLTGMGMGAFGAWKLAAERPTRFAALVPLCGGGDPQWAQRLSTLPTWAFHGKEDRVLPSSSTESLVTALERAGAPVKLTVYEGSDHEIWEQTYDNPELYEWMLKQQRVEAAPRAGSSARTSAQVR